MADSAIPKAQIVEENHKFSTMINRTTSESLRLSETDKISIHPTSLTATSTIPKKKTSFQITSVTVGGHASNDGGDDSADDLDESHAEDISDVIDNSRTDFENETPSYSEDTFSKDDVFFNASTSLGTAPVIPTSSQYGLAIVSTPEGCGNILNSNIPGGNSAPGSDLHVNVTDNVINLGIVSGKHLEGDMRDLHSHTSRNERFKVVKIESTEPFKRGRWVCMDYLDHTMSQQQQNQSQGTVTNANLNKVADNNDPIVVNQCTGADSGISISDNPNTAPTTAEEHCVNNTEQSLSAGNNSSVIGQDQQNLASHSVAAVCGQNSVSPGQTMQFNQGGNLNHAVMNVSQPQAMQQQGQSLTSAVSNQHTQTGTNQHQSLQPQQIQQVISATNLHSQSASLGNQQMQQPIQQMQHQGLTIQQVHQIHQAQSAANLVPQQQYQQANPQMQQANPQMQQIHHQQPLQAVQQPSSILQQQPTISQHLQHQHNISMPLQQQLNQGQIPVQVIANQANMQQIPQQATQMSVHSQMQQIQQNLLQHLQNVAAVSPMSLSGVVNSASQVIQAQASQQQQYHLPTSQSMIQQGIQSQPSIMSLPQNQYFTNSQIQNAMSVQQPISNNNVLQSQAQANPNIAMQQNYPVTSINQQQPQQISVGHTIPPSSISHISQTQIPTTNASVIMSQPNPNAGLNNITIPASQNTVLSPQPTSQGNTLVQQQYVNQPVVSSLPLTQTSVGSQIFVSSTANAGLTSNADNLGLQGYPVEMTNDQAATLFQTNHLTESQCDAPAVTGEEAQQEDAESASGASAVAIDNKIEQAMDLVKSHLMFAVREEVEVLKEKISELMEKITLLESENSILRQHATQETLAQLTSMQPPTSSAP